MHILKLGTRRSNIAPDKGYPAKNPFQGHGNKSYPGNFYWKD